jgi:acetyltransferase-like isoleucine patch superfamily enzyme
VQSSATIYDSTTVVGDVRIGDGTWIGPYCSLDGSGGLTIGHHCSISLGCHLLTHDTVSWALSGGKAPYEMSPTRVGNCCFLGSYTVVVRGLSIGDHVLVAAGAVVTRDVEDHSIVAGVPAHLIGTVEVDESEAVSLCYFDR